MQLALPFAEAIAVAVAKEPLPPMVRDLRCEGSTIHADIDLRAIPDPSTAPAPRRGGGRHGRGHGPVRRLLRRGGDARGDRARPGAPRAQAGAVPRRPDQRRAAGPRPAPGLVEVQRGESEPWVVIAVQDAISAKVEGVTVTDLALRDAVFHVEATVGRAARPAEPTERTSPCPAPSSSAATTSSRTWSTSSSRGGRRAWCPRGDAFGFTVESAYLNRETAEFTWAVSAEGDADEFRRLEQVWMDSPERTAVFEGDRRLERLDRHRARRADRLAARSEQHAARRQERGTPEVGEHRRRLR